MRYDFTPSRIMIPSLAVCIPLQVLGSGDEYGGDHEVESSLPGMILPLILLN